MNQGIRDFSSKLYEAIRDTLKMPQANPRQTFIIGGILILLFAVIVLIIISIYYKYKPQKKMQVKELKEYRLLTTREKSHAILMIIAVVVIVIVGGFLYIEQPSFCLNCHVEKTTYKTWKKNTHKSVGCFGCHRGAGVSGFVIQKIDYFRWIWDNEFNVNKKSIRTVVTNSSCLNCHADKISKTIISMGIRVKHEEILDEGWRCVDCHNSTGHKVTNTKYPSMQICLNCHNSEIAASRCDLCHTPATPGDPRKKREIMPVMVAPVKNCRGCHKPALWKGKCIKCHGLEMPHPPDWHMKHRLTAFFNKTRCFKCHKFPSSKVKPSPHGGYTLQTPDKRFCNRCHSFPSPHGSSVKWAKTHGDYALGKVTSYPKEWACNSCHGKAAEIRYCGTCHGPLFCDSCHEKGKYKSERAKIWILP